MTTPNLQLLIEHFQTLDPDAAQTAQGELLVAVAQELAGVQQDYDSLEQGHGVLARHVAGILGPRFSADPAVAAARGDDPLDTLEVLLRALAPSDVSPGATLTYQRTQGRNGYFTARVVLREEDAPGGPRDVPGTHLAALVEGTVIDKGEEGEPLYAPPSGSVCLRALVARATAAARDHIAALQRALGEGVPEPTAPDAEGSS